MSKTVTIFKHTHNSGSCYVGKVLDEHGFEMRSVGVPVMDLDAFDPLEPDLLLVMGAPIGVYQDDYFPFINRERDIIKARIDADKPTLGICFGAQLIASALGSEVYPGKNGREMGWYPLRLTEEGKNHPARHLSGDKTNMFHWHSDTFDLPEGATLLSSSEKYERQIFSYGKNILGLQCHTEIRNARLEELYVVYVADLTGLDPVIAIDKLRAQGRKYVDHLNIQTKKFLVEWLESVDLL